MARRLQPLDAPVRRFYDTYTGWVWFTVIVAVAVVLLLMWPGWAYHWGWTGLGAHYGPPKNKAGDRDYFPAKTAWDWTQVVGIPITVVGVGFGLNLASKRREQRIADVNRDTDLAIAEDRQQEAALEAYLATMTTLLLDKKLGESKMYDEISAAARAQTLTVLRRLNGERKGIVVRFLQDSRLIELLDLSGADLTDAELVGIDLSQGHLSEARLIGAHLARAELADIDLLNADLSDAHLMSTHLVGADLRLANLRGADLREAEMAEVNLSEADLSGVNLEGALDTTGEQLEQAKSLAGATLPDGTKYP